MADFRNTVLKVISDYKTILRKNVSVDKRMSKMQKLGIKRKYIRDMCDTDLYKIGLKIVEELRKDLGDSATKNSNNLYLGSREFLQYLENVLSEYCIESGEVVHVGRKASCALMNAIQLISFSKGRLRDNEVIQVKEYVDVIAACGDEEQKKMLVDVVNSHQAVLIKHLPEEFSCHIS